MLIRYIRSLDRIGLNTEIQKFKYVSVLFEDLKFKISEGYKQNWSFPVSAQENFNFKPRIDTKFGDPQQYITSVS